MTESDTVVPLYAALIKLQLEHCVQFWLPQYQKTLLRNWRKATEKGNRDAFAPALKPGFWKIPQKWRKTNDSIAYTLTRGECLDLETSDSCISALLGTKEDGGESCSVPDNCSRVMTETHCSGYELSHQLFYFLFAKMKGCSNPLFHNARYYKSLFCHLMMQTNRNLEKMELRNNFADIFTENIMFCGLAGFSDFFKTSWRDFILSRQKQDEGCFWMYSSSNRNEDRVQVAKRSKRSEKIVEGDCSSHNTAVAIGALAGFLYYSF
ncbi:UPF0764 protein C16orf89 homolog [Python bivittatus]|uniref:UPF0764 protein C16orf89 homolog n=1 Tax=Python bivittatus TaxID=176946 RepID=A0A9F5IJ61_PYTBI|nr:UPF0764 protein C16orf89 homolog [Python bivittatus]